MPPRPTSGPPWTGWRRQSSWDTNPPSAAFVPFFSIDRGDLSGRRDLNPQKHATCNQARLLIFSSKGANPLPISPAGDIATSHPD